MKAATVKHFTKHAKAHLTAVNDESEILVLSGPKGMNFVVMTLSEYNSMQETCYLMSSPANAKRLMKSIAEVNGGS